MMEQLGRVISTGFIWALCAGITITALIVGGENNTDGFQTIMFTAVPMISALMATFMIWVAPELARNGRRDSSRRDAIDTATKNKRTATDSESARLATLMELMDEDERAVFKESLKRRVMNEQRLNDDGEFYSESTTLDSLLHDEYDDNKRLRH
ncbi:MAG: hypothetical protein RLP44_20550 [Aggregatilineales bacterium]